MNSTNEFNGLEITEIDIKHLVNKDVEPLQAFVRICLNGIFIINSIKVVKGKFGLFVSFPRDFNKKEQKGYNICYPITKSFHEYATKKILTEYELSQKN
jgi:DNA-binding cell septation regulator SpoVG